MSRIFIGIQCNQLEYLSIIQSDLKKILAQSRINWVEPALFHITIKFLGEVEDSLINTFIDRLHAISTNSEPFKLTPDRIGIFGSKNQPRVLWFGFQPHPLITKLHQLIDVEFSRMGFEKETKKFMPHLTFGRVKQIIEQEELINFLQHPGQINIKDFPVSTFQLYRSILKSHGPEYHVLEDFRLGY